MCFSTAQYILLLHESQTTGADRYGTHRCYRAVFPSSSSSCHLPSHFFGDALSYHVIFFSPLQLLTQSVHLCLMFPLLLFIFPLFLLMYPTIYLFHLHLQSMNRIGTWINRCQWKKSRISKFCFSSLTICFVSSWNYTFCLSICHMLFNPLVCYATSIIQC